MADSSQAHESPDTGSVSVDGTTVHLSLTVDDATLAELIRRSEDPLGLTERILSIGARGVASMGSTLDLSAVEARLRRTAEDASAASEERISKMLSEARDEITRLLDPSAKDSFTSITIDEFASWRDGLFERFDPERQSSHTGRTIAAVAGLLGPGGALETRLAEAMDPTRSDSGLGRLAELLERRITEIRELVAEERGRAGEAERGTSKGFDFEDEIEDALRTCARQMGATVERTSMLPGDLDRSVGDYVVEFDDRTRVVIEAKNKKSLSLTGSGGILEELDLAMANRDASVAICVSKHAGAFPKEVGPINVYGRRILIADPGDGTMVWVALRWARQLADQSSPVSISFDGEAVRDGLQRLNQLAERFRSNRSHLTQIKSSVAAVHESLGDMRRDLLDLADDLAAEIFKTDPTAAVVDFSRAG
ncbi:MAG: hypothetical protein OEQ47_14985 [Acidimicrobiia bacterium]|nr:hypothetical protein [Acidimicrobiia bacterium]